MSEKTKYFFSTLRYVHNVKSGEFLNVGIILFSPSHNFLDGKFRSSVSRVKRVFPDLNSNSFHSTISVVSRRLLKVSKEIYEVDFFQSQNTLKHLMTQVLLQDDSSFQWSQVSGGMSDETPQETLERLYEAYVARYDEKIKTPRKSDDDIWRTFRERLKETKIQLYLEEKTIHGHSDEVTFKHAHKNGIWHAFEPLSFDLSSSENIKDKARKWRGQLEASYEGISEDLKIYFLVGKPREKGLLEAYSHASKILKGSPFQAMVFSEDNQDSLLREITKISH